MDREQRGNREKEDMRRMKDGRMKDPSCYLVVPFPSEQFSTGHTTNTRDFSSHHALCFYVSVKYSACSFSPTR